MAVDRRAEAIHAIHAVEAVLCFGVAVDRAIYVLHGGEAAVNSRPRTESTRDEAGLSVKGHALPSGRVRLCFFRARSYG